MDSCRHNYHLYRFLSVFLLTISVVSISLIQQLISRPAYGATPTANCHVTVVPLSMNANSQQTVTVTVENQDTVMDIAYVQVDVDPSLSIVSGSKAGWSTNVSGGTSLGFSGGTIPPSNVTSFSVTIASGGTPMDSTPITISATKNADGTSVSTCGGTTAINVIASSGGVALSNLAVPVISNTTAQITFSTNIAATSQLKYGTSQSYGTTENISSATTSHSYSLSGLTPQTIYHFQISATDGSSSDASVDESFTTGQNSGLIIQSPTPGPAGVVSTLAPLPTPTPVPDRTPPVVTLITPLNKPYRQPPIISGTAFDNHDVARIEYTIDNGKTWLNVKDTKGLTGTTATFAFTPSQLSEGTTTIKARAKDVAGNVGTSNPVSVIIDQTGPTIAIKTNTATPFTDSPAIEGTASDQSGESGVDYSLDDGKNWQPADKTSFDGSQTTQFSFQIPPLDDGNYPITIRATDPLGNISLSPSHPIVIDRLPPIIGASLVSLGAQILMPQTADQITTIALVPHTITTEVIGGPTQVTITVTGPTPLQKQTTVLTPKNTMNLWSAEITLPTSGSYTLSLYAKDGANHETTKTIAHLTAIPEGTVLDQANNLIESVVTVYVKDQTTGQYVIWNGSPFGQKNPYRISASDHFNFILPAGNYYFEIASNGYQTQETNSFMVTEPTAIGGTFSLLPANPLQLLFSALNFPLFQQTVVPFTPLLQQQQTPLTTTVAFPDMNFISQDDQISYKLSQSTIRAKPTLLTFLNTWGPQTAGQMAQLEQLAANNPNYFIAAVIPEESVSSVTLYKRRGGYTIPIFTDPDGTLLTALPYNFSPTHFFFDQGGVSHKQIIGVQTAQELIQELKP